MTTRNQKRGEDGDQLHLAIKSTVNKLCTSESFITELTNCIFEKTRGDIEKELETLQKKTTELEKVVQKQDDTIKLMAKQNERFEKWIRRNNIIVYGLEEMAIQKAGKEVWTSSGTVFLKLADNKIISIDNLAEV
ncbi:hypothetical protein JTB14_021517 [Gonioctena quinquepunctata]|nr:hypothetical protein JTB14_021517 [Gonioctena quinquepunctata]